MTNFTERLLLKALAKDSGNFSLHANSESPSQALAAADKSKISGTRFYANAFERDAA